MKLTINIKDYLTKEEIKEEFRAAIRQNITSVFLKNESDMNRLISNLGYEFIFNAVSKAINQDISKLITDKVTELCQDKSHIQYLMWRRKDAWENSQSPAIDILDQAIKDNEPAIKSKVSELIAEYDFPDVRQAMYDIACEEIGNKLFRKED